MGICENIYLDTRSDFEDNILQTWFFMAHSKQFIYILILLNRVFPIEYRSDINIRKEMLHLLTIAVKQSIHACIYNLK